VERAPVRVQQVDRVRDLVARPRRRPRRPGDHHRDPGQHQALGQRGQEDLVDDPARMVDHGLRRRPRERHREAVDLLAVRGVRGLPVGDRGQVRGDLADTRADRPRRGLGDQVEVDDHRDRRRYAVRAAPGVVVQRADRGADAVVGQVGGDRDHRQPEPGGGELGHVQHRAAADADDRVVPLLLDLLDQLDRGVDRAAVDGEPVGVDQPVLEGVLHDRPVRRTDRDRDPAGRRDALVGQHLGQLLQGTAPDVDDQRRGDEAG
jgi:hypothetical protein